MKTAIIYTALSLLNLIAFLIGVAFFARYGCHSF